MSGPDAAGGTFEAAGGIVQRFLPGVPLPVLMKGVLPGVLAGAALYPFARTGLGDFLSLDLEKGWTRLAIAAVLVVTLGILISAFHGLFYRVYAGRGWPSFLSDWAVGVQQRRVECLNHKADVEKEKRDKPGAEGERHSQRYDDIWYILRIYPIDPKTSRRRATRPTLLGNIVESYEEYPTIRYGMDSPFYWSRLWLVVEKDQKEEISRSWAVADGLLNLSAVSFLAGLLWFAVSVGAGARLLGSCWFPVGHAFAESIAAVAGWFVLGYAVYRLSLPFHRQNGEIFKSLFDVYREKLKKMTSFAPLEPELWRAAWAYLQYYRIQCPICKKLTLSVFTADCSDEKCPGRHQLEAIADFLRSGELVKPLP